MEESPCERVVTCDISLEKGLGPINSLLSLGNNVSKLDGKSMFACFHTGLLSNLKVVNDTIGTIQTAVDADSGNALVDLSAYQITQQTLEPITPSETLMSIQTMKTDRQSMIGSALTTIGDPQNGAGSAFDCEVTAWCPAFSDAFTGGRPSLFVDYRMLDGASNFDQVEGFLLAYPATPPRAVYHPKTDRGIGGGPTRQQVEAAYADMLVWDWEVADGQFPASADGWDHAFGLSVMPDECSLRALVFTFDDDEVLMTISTGTAWDNCVE